MKLTCVTATFNVIAAGNRERLIRCVESVDRIGIAHEHLVFDGAKIRSEDDRRCYVRFSLMFNPAPRGSERTADGNEPTGDRKD